MHRILVVFLVGLFLVGCKSSLKSGYKDFNAYYNTFYNSKKSYKLGLEKSVSQKRNYNTLEPIRIYQTPMGAGAGDFQNAIDKGADILRKYDDTKWVDDALEIIGKSYFHRQEYFSADQKFEELYVSSDNQVMQQRASFWKGRVLLELQAYNQTVQYLTEQLAQFEGEWKNKLNYEIQTVLAEAYVSRESWVNALDLLNESVPKLPKKAFKERGYFLIGQLNEILGNSEEAFDAYDKVGKHYTEYELQFEAQKKKAEVARTLGKSDEAYKVFSSMVRDDKNTEFVSELNFELGKTEQDRDNFQKAEKIYLNILRDRRAKVESVTKAKVYNGLAEINRFEYNNFELAAAYYDSAAKVNAPEKKLPEDFKAKEFSISFGEYAKIKNEFHLQDSLLWLGMLPQEKFDSVLVELERKKREEIERLQKEQEDRRNTLINVNDSGNQENQQVTNSRNGFLSYKNPVMLAEASQQFNAIWGGRPLVDNWRVSELLINQIQNENEEDTEGEVSTNNASTEVFVSIDLSRVPFTAQDQDSVREELASLNYELANLFFLSLNLPDSAEYYFRKVLDERPNSNVAAVSLYSLSELSSIQGKQDQALLQANQLLARFPNTVYANRVSEKYGLDIPEVDNEVEISPKNKYLAIVEDTISTRASSLTLFEAQNRGNEIAGRALFDVIEIYIQSGKQEPGFEKKLTQWNTLNTDWQLKQSVFKTEQDSAVIFLADTLLSATDSTYYQGLIDSTLTLPDFVNVFPYRGEYWDSTRSKIETFKMHYPRSFFFNRVETLYEEFKIPIEPDAKEVSDDLVELEEESENENYINCKDIDQGLSIRGGMIAFLESVELPSSIQEQEIRFLFFINNRGIIDEFKLSSETDNQSLIDKFVQAIDDNLSFEPVLVEGAASAVQCEMSFPLQ